MNWCRNWYCVVCKGEGIGLGKWDFVLIWIMICLRRYEVFVGEISNVFWSFFWFVEVWCVVLFCVELFWYCFGLDVLVVIVIFLNLLVVWLIICILLLSLNNLVESVGKVNWFFIVIIDFWFFL